MIINIDELKNWNDEARRELEREQERLSAKQEQIGNYLRAMSNSGTVLLLHSVMWNGRDYYYRIQSHSDYPSALKGFTLAQGKEWYGGDTLSDLC